MCVAYKYSRALLPFVIAAILAGHIAAEQGQVAHTKKCADFNEYCQNHWDCCSNSCLSYLYRCTRNYAIFPYTFFGQNAPASATLQEILNSNFGTPRPDTYYQPAPMTMSVASRLGSTDAINTTTTTTATSTAAHLDDATTSEMARKGASSENHSTRIAETPTTMPSLIEGEPLNADKLQGQSEKTSATPALVHSNKISQVRRATPISTNGN